MIEEQTGANNEENILYCLEFLKREAETHGYSDLTHILKTAIALTSVEGIRFGLGVSNDDAFWEDDTRRVASFLLRYLQSSEAVKDKIIEAIEEAGF